MKEGSLDATEYVVSRPPILQAAATLGLRDADIARQLGVSRVTVSQWVLGKRPIPRVRAVAIEFLVCDALDRLDPDDVSPRVEAARVAALNWLRLAREEVGGEPSDQMTFAAIAMLNRGHSEGQELIERMYQYALQTGLVEWPGTLASLVKIIEAEEDMLRKFADFQESKERFVDLMMAAHGGKEQAVEQDREEPTSEQDNAA